MYVHIHNHIHLHIYNTYIVGRAAAEAFSPSAARRLFRTASPPLPSTRLPGSRPRHSPRQGRSQENVGVRRRRIGRRRGGKIGASSGVLLIMSRGNHGKIYYGKTPVFAYFLGQKSDKMRVMVINHD